LPGNAAGMSEALPEAWREVPPVREAAGEVDFAAEVAAGIEPHILRGATAAWPLVRAGLASPREFCAYLTTRANQQPAELWVAPPGLAGRFGFTEGMDGFNFDRKHATIEQICGLLLRCVAEHAGHSLYAGAVSLPKHLPNLAAELPLPVPLPAQDRLTSLWIGSRSCTATHWDRPANLACPVLGERLFLLFPPAAIGDLYMGPLDQTLAGQPTSLVDAEAPDFARFPRFAQALEQARLAVVGPGDALFLPPLWFHCVLSPAAIGAQINFWWIVGGADQMSPFNTLLHALLSLRHLPDAERANWRAFFEYYIFAADDATHAHIPPAARGPLGPMSEAAQQALSRQLGERLLRWGGG